MCTSLAFTSTLATTLHSNTVLHARTTSDCQPYTPSPLERTIVYTSQAEATR